MRNRLRAALTTLVLLCVVLLCDCEKVTVTILHTNDVHGHLQPYARHTRHKHCYDMTHDTQHTLPLTMQYTSLPVIFTLLRILSLSHHSFLTFRVSFSLFISSFLRSARLLLRHAVQTISGQ